jgi:sialate O-acetylesterase
MVIQRNSVTTVWGWSIGGNSVIDVKVSWSDSTYSTRSNGLSKWEVQIPTPEAGGPYEISINNSIILKDVLIGEVWVCSGQSNMDWSALSGINNAETVIKEANNNQIRFFTVPKVGAATPQIDIDGKWELCSSETMPSFSAVAYFFGKELQEELNIPVGLIHTSWGGTSAEVWTPENIINADKAFANWENIFSSSGYQPRAPGVLYNAMIHPLVPFDIAGAIWYQGESNTVNPFVYRRLFPTMIQSWRAAWEKDFPFYYVQIAPYKYAKAMEGALVQEAQRMTLSAIDNVGMVVINDIGNVDDIHPQNKLDVGKRLARWALNKDYGKEIVCSGPLYQSMEKKGNTLVLTFQYAEGLYFKNGKPQELFVAEANGIFYPADAKIEGQTLIISHPDISNPEFVRYAFSNTAIGNLFNADGLPASPFRTDDQPFILTPVNIEVIGKGKKAVIQLKAAGKVDEIRYTMDGTIPRADAEKYTTPIAMNKPFHLKARAVVDGQFSEAIIEKEFELSKSTFTEVILDNDYNPNYKSTGQNALTDGSKGSLVFGDGNWQGYHGTDVVATIDLGELKKVKRIKTNFLQDQGVWIFLPGEVEIAISKDGRNFTKVHAIRNDQTENKEIVIQTVEKLAINKKARYIRITAKSPGTCPDWHPGAGGKTWVFIDEVVVE